MIIVKLMGGLGNQMFQYAAGKTLSLKHATPLLIDTTFLNQAPNGAYTKRELELTVFDMPLVLSNEKQLKQFEVPKSRFQRIMQQVMPLRKSFRYAAERGMGYQSFFESLPANTYLDGFWQNERYFENQREVLLNEFRPKEKMPPEIEKYAQLIQSKTTLSLHVRRGDYVTLQSAKDFHGVCDMTYYQKALALMAEKVGNFQVLIFSDDIAWCKQNFENNGGIDFVEHKCNAVWDLMLMSMCNHNIIANSSFSWWGAWLNPHKNKIVTMPQQWFTGVSAQQIGINAKNWVLL